MNNNIIDIDTADLTRKFQIFIAEELSYKDSEYNDSEINLFDLSAENLAIHDLTNDELWIFKEDFPTGQYPMIYNHENSCMFVKFNPDTKIERWEIAKLTRISCGFSEFPDFLTINDKESKGKIESQGINIIEIDGFLSTEIRQMLDSNPDNVKDDNNFFKLFLPKGTKSQDTCDCERNAGINPFIGYDSEDKIACLLFHFKSNSEVMEGRK